MNSPDRERRTPSEKQETGSEGESGPQYGTGPQCGDRHYPSKGQKVGGGKRRWEIEENSDGITQVHVYHVKREAPRGVAFFEHPESWEERKDLYRKVALGRTNRFSGQEALEEAWRDLQHGISGGCWMKEHVMNRRSTSVGDVLLLQETGGWTPFEVGSLGFREISERNESASLGPQELFEIEDLREKSQSGERTPSKKNPSREN